MGVDLLFLAFRFITHQTANGLAGAWQDPRAATVWQDDRGPDSWHGTRILCQPLHFVTNKHALTGSMMTRLRVNKNNRVK